jgi:hypothetical protein
VIAQHEPRQPWQAVSWLHASAYAATLLAARLGLWDEVVYNGDRMHVAQSIYVRHP